MGAAKADNARGEAAVPEPLPGESASRYVVVARRYRPQTFDELIGQEHVAPGAQGGDRRQPGRPRLPVHRRPRSRQDVGRPNPGQGPQLRARSDAHPLQPLRHLPVDRRRHRHRRVGDRRGQQPRHRRDPAIAPERQHPSQPRPLQDLHHRRSPHAHARGLQRLAQDARRAARARQVHLLHDRSHQAAGDDPLALPALRLCGHPDALDRRAAAADRRSRGGHGRAARRSS